MSVIDSVKKIIAEMADGYHHAVLHLAGEVDKIKAGGVAALPADLLKQLEAGMQAKIDEGLKAIGDQVGKLVVDASERLSQLEKQVAVLSQAQPAPAPEAPKSDAAPAAENAGTAQTDHLGNSGAPKTAEGVAAAS